MDDQEGATSVTSVSEPTVHEGDETLMDNLGREGQADEPYDEGDEGEIMVEVVGSDVFVDGVRGDVGELGHEGSGKVDTLNELRDFQLRDSSGGAGEEDDGNTRNGVEGVHEVAGSSRDVAEAAGTEIVPGVLSVTTCSVVEKVNFSVNEEDIVRSTESAAPADLASLDVSGSSTGVSETVDNESIPRLLSETADRVLEQVSHGVREDDDEGNVVRSTVSVEGSAELSPQNPDLSGDGVWNPGIEPLVGSSSVVPKDSLNLETDEASNLRFDSSEKDECSVREIVGQASEKDISSHARDQISYHPDEGAVSGNSGVVQKTHSEVETMETFAHDQERDTLGDKDENSHSEVEPMETDVRDQQRDDLRNKDEVSHQDSGLLLKKHSEAETMETHVHDKETVGLGNKDENSHPDVEPMETDVYDQDGGMLNKDQSNKVVELLETIKHDDDQINNMCHQVPAGHDNLGVDIAESQDSPTDCADEMVSLRPNIQIPEDKGGDIKVVSVDSRISAEHVPVTHDHSLGINGNNEPSHPGKQEHGFEGKLAAENGVVGSFCEKANHAEVQELKVDNMHEDKSNFALCTQAETSHTEIQTSNHKEVSLEGSEISSCKVPITSDNGNLGGSDELSNVQPKVAGGVSEVTHDDFPLSVQASAHDTGHLDEMEVEGVRHETTVTLTFPINDESLNIVEVDARFENDARIGPLETSYEPACRNDGDSVEMHKDGDSVEGSAELSPQNPDLSGDGVWNPGIEPLVGSSSVVPKDSLNLETDEASNLRFDSSEKDECSVREIVGQASEKDISSHARDQISYHPDEGAVSGNSGVVQKTHSEVETMETFAHDQERDTLGDKDENSHSEVEPMETDVRDQQRDDLRNKDEVSHQDSGLLLKKHSEAETMETHVHDKETVGLGNKDENSHPDVEPMETDVYDQDGGMLNKDQSNKVVELLETIKHDDDQINNMCHQVPAGHDNLGVDIAESQDSPTDCADEMVSLRPNIQIPEDKGGDIKVVSVDSRISAEHAPVTHDHSLGINGNNEPSHPGKQEHGFEGKLAAENGVVGSFCEKANHAEVQELKVDNMHEDKSNFALCTQAETSHTEIQTSNHKEVSLEGSEISSCKVPITSDNGNLGGSDELSNVQPKVAGGVSEVTHDDFPLSVQASAHDTGHLDEMEVEGVRHETTVTLTFPINDESLNIVEVDARFENDARIGPLETSYEPACRNDGDSVEMHKDGDALLRTTTASLSCTEGKNILEDETRVSLETMVSTRDMNSGDEANKVTHLLPEGLDGNMSLQHVENESLLLFDNHAGKEGDPQMSAVSSNDDVVTEVPEGTSLACQDTSKTPDSNAVNVKSPLLKENDFEVEAEHNVEAKDTALGEGPAQDDDVAHDTKKGAVTGMHSNITEESESSMNQEGVMEHVNELDFEMDLDAGNAATVDKILYEENNSNLEGAIKSQAAINSGANVPPPVRDQIVETCISDTSNSSMNQVNEDQDSFKATEGLVFHVHAPEMKVADEQEKGKVEKLHPGTVQEFPEQDKGAEEVASKTSHTVMVNEKPVSLLNMHLGYLIPPANEGEYSISDLVWGKVRSHPWWPGQIFDPSDASEKAIKYHKKDSFLVAYFGDRTFAWNDAFVLRPFYSHFSQIEKQSSSETFQNAISCALEEVSRRVELGLTCSCTSEDSYNEISCQILENTGIREESSKRYGVDKSTGVTSFAPDKLIHYMKALALSPTCRADRLDLTIARAQLVAFCHFKGYRLPPQFLLSGELLENDDDIPHVDSAIDDNGHASEGSEQHPTSKVSAHKCKHSSKNSSQNKMKEQSLSELMDNMECEYCPDGEENSDEKTFPSSKKRKAVDSRTGGSDKKTGVYAAKVSTTVSVSPKPSFRIGECIQRVASQLTRSASHLKCNSDQSGADVQLQDSPKGKVVIPTELPSPNELLAQLQLVARAPLKVYNFLKTITTFFSGFRNSVAVGPNSRRQSSSVGRAGGGRKKRASQTVAGFAEEFEFDDVNDSYWTDRIVQNCGEEQPLQNNQSGEGEHQLTVHDPEKSSEPGRRSYTRKRKSSADYDMTPGVPPEDIEKRKHEPAELILIFAEGGPLPSEMNLNKMFRRFGPLKELETEVHQESSRARVVFKRGSDAEVAHSSVGKFNIFGSRRVMYELSYTPVISFKPMLLTITPDLEGAI